MQTRGLNISPRVSLFATYVSASALGLLNVSVVQIAAVLVLLALGLGRILQ